MKYAFTLALMAALAVPPALAQKFRADDPVWVDEDAAVNVKEIARHKLNDQYDFLLNSFGKPGDPTRRRAMNVNTLGEVPSSSWFENRHAMMRMSLEELSRGPDTGNGPAMDAPWTVIAAKTEGITPGFRIRDGRGDVYFLKFDPPGNSEMTTAAEVISTKFFYALGYNVPENYLTFFKRDQLRVHSKARIADSAGRERTLTDADLDAILQGIHRSPDGTYRAVASKLLAGEPLGPFQYFGTRPDDPNDIFPHEHRRELRALRVFGSWLNHDDSRAINTLDMLVENDGHRYVRHYLIDFGSTLGSGSVGPQKPRAGWEYMWEPSSALKRIVTLGLWDKQWIRVNYPEYAAVGRFEAVNFEPENWKPEYPNPAFRNATDEDGFWAARMVMAFTDGEIRAIVRTGRLSDPAAENYLAETLMARRDKIGQYWLTRTSSFDQFCIVEGELHFEHLASFYDFARRPEYQLAWFAFDPVSGERELLIDGGGLFAADGYWLAELTSTEGRVSVYVRTTNGIPQIVGVER
jgi:hypothetical protein